MRTCPNCTTELVVDGGERCPVCNALLTTEAPAKAAHGDDDLQFDVREASEDDRDLVGGSPRVSRRGELDIEDESHITAHQTSPSHFMAPEPASPDNNLPITKQGTPSQPPPTPETEINGIKKLSAQEIDSIAKSLYGNQSYLSEKDKIAAIKKADAAARNAVSGSDASTNGQPGDKPAMARRVRGIAWFYKNWIQVTGESDLREHEEIIVHERAFVLRKKRFSPRVVFAIATPLAAVLLFVVASFLTPSITGKGRIVGCVFDESGRPVDRLVTVRLPDDGQSIETNAQGFFVTDPVKGGSHKVEASLDGKGVSSDFATVVANQVTTIRLTLKPRPSNIISAEPAEPIDEDTPIQDQSPSQSARQSRPRVSATSGDSPGRSMETPGDPNAKLLLNASVDGATLTLDGKVIGAGNLTYSRLKPGQYLYLVSKDGYQNVGGSVQLSAGKTTSLDVDLSPIPTKSASRAERLADGQHYQAGLDALAASDLSTAEQEFTLAINEKPDLAAAYVGLGDTKVKSGQQEEACANFNRAAELYRSAGKMSEALKAYNSAVLADKTSIPGLLGRGYLYLSRGEEIAAIGDFQTVVSLDKRNALAHLGLGRSRFAQGNSKEALKHFKDARSADSQNPEVYEYLMLCYFAQDNLKDAKKAYEAFTEVASADQVARLQRNSKFSAVLRVVQE